MKTVKNVLVVKFFQMIGRKKLIYPSRFAKTSQKGRYFRMERCDKMKVMSKKERKR